jgi:hypothetical protein
MLRHYVGGRSLVSQPVLKVLKPGLQSAVATPVTDSGFATEQRGRDIDLPLDDFRKLITFSPAAAA